MAPILMPDAETYGIAILVLHAAGSSSLASQIHNRWWHADRVPYGQIYLSILAAVAFLGAFVLDCRPIVGRPNAWLLALPCGILGGYLATTVDRVITRRITTQQVALPKRHILTRPAIGFSGSHSTLKVTVPFQTPEGTDPFVKYGFTFWSLAFVAFFEEIVHRGWIVEICQLLPKVWMQGGAMVFALLVFAVLHLHFGRWHLLAKFSLGGLALLGVLVTGTVITGIVTHLWFNTWVWNTYCSKLSLSKQKDRY